jgi:4-hydroxy-4-methyl-2-oxoglutarate aldolase
MDYRPFQDQLERCYSAVLADVLDSLGYRQQCMSPTLRPLTAEMRTWGEAVTLYLEAVDEVPARPYQLEMEAIDALTPGQLVVAQCNAAKLCAFWGGLLSNAAVGHGGAGVVTDGGARDYHEIVQLGFPVFCRGLSPYDSMGRMETLARNVAITCGGVLVSPGDLVYADVDGIVVVPERAAERAIALAWAKVQGENKVREELRAGASVVATFEKYHIL